MWALWIVIGLLVGLGGAFLYYKKAVEPGNDDARQVAERLYQQAIAGQEAANAKVLEFQGAVEAAWGAKWGPYGIPPEAQDDLFNHLWALAGKEKHGMPRD